MIFPELILRHIINDEIPSELIDKLNHGNKEKFFKLIGQTYSTKLSE
jgi:hypothetical protein